MANTPIKTDYVLGQKILLHPVFEAHPHTFLKGDAAAKTVDNKSIVKAGTIYPTNDASATGVVLYDVDITNGDAQGALIYKGVINTKRIEEQPASGAKTALPQVRFV